MAKRKASHRNPTVEITEVAEAAQSIKPNIIINLEKIYNIELTEQPLKSLDENENSRIALSSNTYSLNENGTIIGFSIHNYRKKSFLFSDIASLTSLQYLSLTSCRITNIDDIINFTQISRLYIGGNQISDISALSKLTSIQYLAIWGNPIKSLDEIKHLINLRVLYCQNIPLNSLDFLEKLTNLRELSLDKCEIKDIKEISNLLELRTLLLAHNKIDNLKPLCKLKNVNRLDVEGNLITHIPIEVAEHYSWLENSIDDINSRNGRRRTTLKNHIELTGNPLVFPPTSVISSDSEAVENYYRTTSLFGHAPLSEGRIIVVGDGSAGKSSLIERILHDTFDENKQQTNGVLISNLNLKHSDGRELIFHLWDFGGQEIQHAVHKFFFTEGCLYLLVLDNRKEEEPEYWLQQIESLGGSAPVLIVFNKHDQNPIEVADKKFLKEKYSNIVGFYNISCKSAFGIHDLKAELAKEAIKLRTVDEQFPNNWFEIKKDVVEKTFGENHYISYEMFSRICIRNHVTSKNSKDLLLKYFNTIGAVTWFGETYLKNLNVLSPAWITQGVYKIVTSPKTLELLGHISIENFKELLQPTSEQDYIYEDIHYDYILTMMKKFGLCYSADNRIILLPSAFGKEPRVEYRDFRGKDTRAYILSFEEYMPIALIHRFISLNISSAYEENYWYSGIVIKDEMSSSLAMVQADKEAKRIYVRIKGTAQLGMWEHIRRELKKISTTGYSGLNYTELVALDDTMAATVSYEDLISHLKANKATFFHPKLQLDFPVGELLGLFEPKELTIDKFKNGEHIIRSTEFGMSPQIPQFAINILTQNVINNNISIELIQKHGSEVKSEANYLIDEIGNSNKQLVEALTKIVDFAQSAKEAKTSEEIKEKGWGRKIKGVVETLAKSGDQLKKINDGTEAMHKLAGSMHDLAAHLNMHELSDAWHHLQNLFI